MDATERPDDGLDVGAQAALAEHEEGRLAVGGEADEVSAVEAQVTVTDGVQRVGSRHTPPACRMSGQQSILRLLCPTGHGRHQPSGRRKPSRPSSHRLHRRQGPRLLIPPSADAHRRDRSCVGGRRRTARPLPAAHAPGLTPTVTRAPPGPAPAGSRGTVHGRRSGVGLTLPRLTIDLDAVAAATRRLRPTCTPAG